MIATFSPAVRSIGLDVVALFGGTTLSVTVFTGDGPQQVDVALSGSGTSFIGFTAESGITGVSAANPPDQSDYACVDNVSYGGNEEPADPALACLDALQAAVESGMAGGCIKGGGSSLLDKVALARAYVLAGDDASATQTIAGFKNELKAQTGKKIASGTAAKLQALADECIAAIAL
jgi:hypothetical protein